MANKTILERLGLTVSDLERIYAEEGSLDRVAARIGCSRPTVVKYLRHVEKDRTPWKTHRNRALPTQASAEWQQRVFDEVHHALQFKRVWMDTNQRKIPAQFLKGAYFELPEYEGPVIPVYAVLRDNTRVVLLHPLKEYTNAQNTPQASTSAERQEPRPTLSHADTTAPEVQHSPDNQGAARVQRRSAKWGVHTGRETNQHPHVHGGEDQGEDGAGDL